jgi:type IV pilus assembly protein PilC
MTGSAVRKKAKGGFSLEDLEEKLNVAMASVTVKDLAVFARQFAAMFNAGVPMIRCLQVLRD